jgi:acetyl esterase
MLRSLTLLLAVASGFTFMPSKLFAAESPSDRIVYKQVDGRTLSLEVFNPTRKIAGPGACAVLFHGGGFARGKTSSVYPMAQALADQGMTAMSVEYRLLDRAGGEVNASPVVDARSAMRWVRAHASRFNCAPDRIAAGGRSAGGTLALLTAMKLEFDDPKDDLSTSPAPNAMVLFNPGVNLVDGHDGEGTPEFRRKVSPLHLLDVSRIPPTLIMHGTNDQVSPYEEVVKFRDKAQKLGADVNLVSFKGRGHGFFKKNKRDGEDFDASINEMVTFFRRIGWI